MGRRPHPGLADAQQLRRRYVDDGATLAQLAAELGVDPRAVARALDRHGIARHPPPAPSPAAPVPAGRSGRRPGARTPVARLADRDWLAAQYGAGRSTRDLAAELGCTAEAVRLALKRHGLSARAADLDPRLDDAAWLATALTTRSQRQVAAELGVASSVLSRHARALGVRGDRSPSRLEDRDWLEREYLRRGRSTTAIGAELGCSAPTVAAALRRAGIPVRARGGGHRRG